MADLPDPAAAMLREAVAVAMDVLRAVADGTEFAPREDAQEAHELLRKGMEATEPKPQTFRLGLVVELDVEAFSQEEAFLSLQANAEQGPGTHRVKVFTDPRVMWQWLTAPEGEMVPPSVYAARTGEKADHPFVASFAGGTLCALPDCRLPEGDHERPTTAEDDPTAEDDS